MAQYRPLHGEDVNEGGPQALKDSSYQSRWIFRIRTWIIYLLAFYGIINLCLMLWTHRALPKSAETHAHTHSPCSCGQSPAEAIARGCKFDPFALAWLPDACRDDDLILEFEDLGRINNHSWEFYTWPDAAKRVNLSEVAMMADVVGGKNRTAVTTTVDWHHTHCLYLWRKLYRSRYTKVTMEGRYDSEHHQKHCVESILEWVRVQSPADQLLGGSVIDLYSDEVETETERAHH